MEMGWFQFSIFAGFILFIYIAWKNKQDEKNAFKDRMKKRKNKSTIKIKID